MASCDSLAAHLEDIDRECDRLTAKLNRDFDGDISVRRDSENEVGPVRVAFEFGVDLFVEPGDSVLDELVWAIECIAGELGRRVVRKDGA